MKKKRRIFKKNKKKCFFRKNKIKAVDYKDIDTLKLFIDKNGKIIHSRFSKVSAKYQRRLSKAIKLARQMALLPYGI
ncbi:MAG: 30S ribosomal protein S18 [Bacilli bacterium]|nr:30S ribosomal protein S18 [Bacilli bacterium]